MEKLKSFFDNANIAYQFYQHEAVYTVDQAKALIFNEDILEIKNLFLRNKKKNAYYLFSLPAESELTLAQLAEIAGEKKLSFASPEELATHLHVVPGAVSLLNLVNDEDKAVSYYIEQAILTYPSVAFHPNRNDQTLVFDGAIIPQMMTSFGVSNVHIFETMKMFP